MFRKLIPAFIFGVLFIFAALPAAAQKSCFTAEARELAERTARRPGRAPIDALPRARRLRRRIGLTGSSPPPIR